MGYSISLIAIQSDDADRALSHLGLNRTGQLCEYAQEPISGYSLPGNWFLIVTKGCDSPLLKPKNLGPLSQYFPVVACSIEEHVMFSSAEYWADGTMQWRAEHVGEDGPIHLETAGKLPSNFEAIATIHKEQQEADGGEKADVDHYFEIPLNAAKSIIGFKHDEEISVIDYDSFEILSKAPKSREERPWWRFWN